MKKQTLPGYTAETTFYEANKLYNQTAKFLDFSEGKEIIPQRIKLGTVHCICDPSTDVCVCDNGRVLDPYRMLDRGWFF